MTTGAVPLRWLVWRFVMASCLLAWFVKLPIQTKLFFQGAENAIYSQSLLPDWLCRPDLGGVFYFAPALNLWSLFTRRRGVLLGAGALQVLCSLLMLWHVQSYNDFTHLTGFWVGLWLCWWAAQVDKNDEASHWHGVALALGIVSLCWLGGAVGKLTPEYWRGEPFYDLYFMEKDYFPFTYWRAHLPPAQIHLMAQWFSRIVVVTECLLATSVFWPTRLAAISNLLALTGMVIISQLQLFSVLGPLMALSIAAAWLHDQAPNAPQKTA